MTDTAVVGASQYSPCSGTGFALSSGCQAVPLGQFSKTRLEALQIQPLSNGGDVLQVSDIDIGTYLMMDSNLHAEVTCAMRSRVARWTLFAYMAGGTDKCNLTPLPGSYSRLDVSQSHRGSLNIKACFTIPADVAFYAVQVGALAFDSCGGAVHNAIQLATPPTPCSEAACIAAAHNMVVRKIADPEVVKNPTKAVQVRDIHVRQSIGRQ